MDVAFDYIFCLVHFTSTPLISRRFIARPPLLVHIPPIFSPSLFLFSSSSFQLSCVRLKAAISQLFTRHLVLVRLSSLSLQLHNPHVSHIWKSLGLEGFRSRAHIRRDAMSTKFCPCSDTRLRSPLDHYGEVKLLRTHRDEQIAVLR